MPKNVPPSTPLWLNWIGLPYAFDEDPRDGRGCSCLLMCRILLTEAGQYFPPIERTLLTMARAGAWSELRETFMQYTEPLPGPEPWAITPTEDDGQAFGLGTVVPEGYLLAPHTRRGVCAVPLGVLRTDAFYRVRPR